MTVIFNITDANSAECQYRLSTNLKVRLILVWFPHVLEGQQERRTSDPTSGTANGPMSPPYCGPFVQVGHQGLEGWPIHFPPRMPNISTAPGRDFQPINPVNCYCKSGFGTVFCWVGVLSRI